MTTGAMQGNDMIIVMFDWNAISVGRKTGGKG